MDSGTIDAHIERAVNRGRDEERGAELVRAYKRKRKDALKQVKRSLWGAAAFASFGILLFCLFLYDAVTYSLVFLIPAGCVLTVLLPAWQMARGGRELHKIVRESDAFIRRRLPHVGL